MSPYAEIPVLTDEQLMAEIEDILSETWVDPMEIEEPNLDSEVGFDQEFVRDCD